LEAFYGGVLMPEAGTDSESQMNSLCNSFLYNLITEEEAKAAGSELSPPRSMKENLSSQCPHRIEVQLTDPH
jgi:hypothetical protein